MARHLDDEFRHLSTEERLELMDALWRQITARGELHPLHREYAIDLVERMTADLNVRPKPVPQKPNNVRDGWLGHWIFNTNEVNCQGAYLRMFQLGVAAIYGYEDGPRKLQGARPGDKLFAYVNTQGIRALGRVLTGKVIPGKGVFMDADGTQRWNEFHLEMDWEVLLSRHTAITPAEAKKLGYPLPVRCTFGKMYDGKAAKVLENQMRRMAK